jgi:hypothetical protein
MGTRKIDKQVNYLHIPTQTKQQVGYNYWMKNMVELPHFVIFQTMYKKLDDEVCLIWSSTEGLIIWG